MIRCPEVKKKKKKRKLYITKFAEQIKGKVGRCYRYA